MLELEKIMGRKAKPSEFAKIFFDFDLFPFQKEAIDCEDRFVMLNWGRQTGKTTITALTGLYNALWNDGHTILVLSPKQRQSNRLFGKMKNFLLRSHRKFPELQIYNEISRETATILEFINGSEIYSLPIAIDGSNIRGFTADMIIIDEAARITNEEAWSAIKPMIITTNGKMWLISTPKGTNNYFYRCYKDKDMHFKSFHATSYNNPMADMSQIEGDKKWLPVILWEEEYLAKFIDESDSFFPLRLIERFFSKNINERDMPLPNCDYFMGCDPASVGLDSTVLVILEKHANWTAVVKYIETKETTMETAGRIKKLNELWKFKKIIIDQTGLGTGMVEFLIQEKLPVEGIHQTNKIKEDMYNNLKMQMTTGLLSIYDDKARKQLLDMKYAYTKTGYLSIQSSQRSHTMPGGDDYCTALCLATLPLKTPVTKVLATTATSIM